MKFSNPRNKRAKIGTRQALAYVLCAIVAFMVMSVAQFYSLQQQQQQQRERQQYNDGQQKQQRQQQRQQQQQRNDQSSSNATSSGSTEFHIVFSTGCNAFQDWQSYVFFYQAWKSDHSGPVTRVASGCSGKEAERAIQASFAEQIKTMSKDFFLHLTPDYSTTVIPGLTYKFFNKPHGLNHWMKEGLGFPESLDRYKNTIFVIMDPDQFILRPFQKDYRNDPTAEWHPKSVLDNPPLIIEEGRPFGQLYAFGGGFVRKLSSDVPSIVAAALEANGSDKDPKDPSSSFLYQWTPQDASAYYAAGPPYIAVASDMWKIVSTWAAVVAPVYQMTKEHLSEMFAYSVAAAHLELKHVLAYSFMVSDPTIQRSEGFNWMDSAPSERMCQNHDHDDVTNKLPQVLHYCQRYFLGPYFFSKYKLPKDFLDCDHPLLIDPVEQEGTTDIAPLYTSSVTPNGEMNVMLSLNYRKRHSFMLCQMTHKMNDAATYFKQQHCNRNVAANFSKVWVFPHDKK